MLIKLFNRQLLYSAVPWYHKLMSLYRKILHCLKINIKLKQCKWKVAECDDDKSLFCLQLESHWMPNTTRRHSSTVNLPAAHCSMKTPWQPLKTCRKLSASWRQDKTVEAVDAADTWTRNWAGEWPVKPLNGRLTLIMAPLTDGTDRMVWDGFHKRLCSQSRINLAGSLIISVIIVVVIYKIHTADGCRVHAALVKLIFCPVHF